MNTFDELRIVKHIKTRDNLLYSKIINVFRACQTILGQIPSVFPNYTLHDINHSIRVIDYMTDFLSDDLSVYSNLHLSMIVFVGLLHDIGMFVTEDELITEYSRLEKDPEFSSKTKEEKRLFVQDIFRQKHGDRVANKLNLQIIPGQTIRSLLFVGESYDISATVAQVCQSHTKDIAWIIKYIPKCKNIAFDNINPQQIAMLLRLGDALDIDDRRAPWILYNAICPKGVSNSEWKKHIPITNYKKVSYNGKEKKYAIGFSGECSNPVIYRKVMDYIRWIDSEVIQINRTLSCYDLPYKFEIITPIQKDITPIGFTLCDLQFQLKYDQIARLLMGENLYGSKREGLRELLQNAIDAILLMNSISLSNGDTYVPRIEINLNKKAGIVSITDNGTGMSQQILMDYFFNIGNSYYVSKQYREQHYSYSPIGKYGIGFLACFMLSSNVTLLTKYYSSGEVIKVDFEKDSPYITLTVCDEPLFPLRSGTQIILDYGELVEGVFGSEESLTEYVQQLIINDDYACIINTCDKTTEISNPFPRKGTGVIENDDFVISFEADSLVEIVTDIVQLPTPNPNNVFFSNLELHSEQEYYHDAGFVSVEYLYEAIDSFERYFQTSKIEDVEKALAEITDDDIYEGEFYEKIFEDIVFSSNTLEEMICLYQSDLIDYYRQNQELQGFFSDHMLRKCIKGEKIVWYNVPYIQDPSILKEYLTKLDKTSYENAFDEYFSNIKTFSVFGRDKEDEALFIAIASHLCDDNSRYDYFYEYPFKPELNECPIIVLPNIPAYLPVGRDYIFAARNVTCKVFKKGIWIHNVSLSLPYYIQGLNLKQIYINIKSDKFEINVSRSDLTKQSRDALEQAIGKAIYEWYVDKRGSILPLQELALINQFIKRYYS